MIIWGHFPAENPSFKLVRVFLLVLAKKYTLWLNLKTIWKVLSYFETSFINTDIE